MKIIPQNTPKQPSLFDLLPENQPLPIRVSVQWDFPLQRYETSDGILYAIQDWIAGIGSTKAQTAAKAWVDVQNQLLLSKSYLKIVQLDYLASNDKTYQMDFTDDKGLYRISQELRVTKKRPALDAIKKFLAAAGAFADEVSRNPEMPKTKKQRKLEYDLDLIDKVWADNHEGRERIQLQIDVIKSWQTLQATVKDIVNSPNYGHLTNTEYLNLFGMTAQGLKDKLNSKDIRSDLATMALSTLRHAETMLASILRRSSGNLTMEQTKAIYDHVLKPIGDTHESICIQFGIHPITGKPLLPSCA